MPSPAEFAANLRAQKLKRRTRRLIISGGGALLVLIVGLLAWLLVFSPVLDARIVEVEGVKLLDEQTVIDTAAVPLGTPLARVRAGQVADRVATHSEVRNAFVTRKFPNTIHIEVVERVPLFQMGKGGAFSYIDAEGHAVRESQPHHATLPEVKVVKADARKLIDVGTVVEALPESVAKQVALVELKSVDRIEIRLQDGPRVVWGSAEDSELKAQVLEPLLQVDAKVYDVSAPNHPTTR